MKDVHGRKIFANKAECEFLGLSEKEILGKTESELYDKEVYQVSNEEDRNVILKSQEIRDKEVLAVSNKGDKRWLQVSKIPLKNIEGANVGLVGISNNITDLKLKEEELRKAVDVMSSQNKRLQNFTYIVSHNIRSYATNIAGLIDLYKLEEDPA